VKKKSDCQFFIKDFTYLLPHIDVDLIIVIKEITAMANPNLVRQI
jgi:hypothetical protein